MAPSAVSSRDVAQRLIVRIDGIQDAADPLRLAERAGFVPDDWQLRILNSTSPILLINCARQIGKSTAVGLRLTKTLQQPDKTIVIFSPGGRQSKELLLRALRFWRRIGRPVPHTGIGKEHLELVNGSRIIALPGSPNTTVGFTPDLIVIEEAARTEDELFHAISPMAGQSGAPIIALTTPHGKRGWFHDLWAPQDDGSPWPPKDTSDTRIERILATAEEYPDRYQPGFLVAERRTNPMYDEHFRCMFLDDERQAFSSSDIAAAQVDGLESWSWALSA